MDEIDRATTLYYSDDPETLSAAVQGHVDGVLFDFDLVAGNPQRFLIYHVNGDEAIRTLALRFYNQGSANSRISYVSSLPPGSTDYLGTGHASTLGFIRALASGSRRVINIASGANEVAETIRLSQGSLAAGIFEFSLLVGTKVRCSLVSVSDPDDVIATAHAGAVFERDAFGRRGRFDISDKSTIAVRADASSPAIVARLGQRRFPNLEKSSDGSIGNSLKGEYGVFTAIQLSIVNETDIPKTVALYESAHGGASTGSYLIDGRLVDSGTMRCASPNPRYKIAMYAVPGPGKVISNIMTMPDSASNSPVVLMLDADDQTIPDPNSPQSIVAYLE